MKLKQTFILTIIGFILAVSCASNAFAQGCCNGWVPCYNNQVFVLLGSGASASRDARLSVDTPPWDAANEGYGGNLSHSVLYTAGLGYVFCPLVSSDIEVTYRPSFTYNKFQTAVAGASNPGVLGAKTREFDLSDTSIMGNVFLNGEGANLFACLNRCTILQPFIGGGIGVAYNHLSNFHSVLEETSSLGPGSSNVASIMNANTNTAFAWQLMAGAELLNRHKWGIDVGYRYFDGGRFKSNNYLVDVPGGSTTPVTITPWSGRLTANEVFANLKYRF